MKKIEKCHICWSIDTGIMVDCYFPARYSTIFSAGIRTNHELVCARCTQTFEKYIEAWKREMGEIGSKEQKLKGEKARLVEEYRQKLEKEILA